MRNCGAIAATAFGGGGANPSGAVGVDATISATITGASSVTVAVGAIPPWALEVAVASTRAPTTALPVATLRTRRGYRCGRRGPRARRNRPPRPDRELIGSDTRRSSNPVQSHTRRSRADTPVRSRSLRCSHA